MYGRADIGSVDHTPVDVAGDVDGVAYDIVAGCGSGVGVYPQTKISLIIVVSGHLYIISTALRQYIVDKRVVIVETAVFVTSEFRAVATVVHGYL